MSHHTPGKIKQTQVKSWALLISIFFQMDKMGTVTLNHSSVCCNLNRRTAFLPACRATENTVTKITHNLQAQEPLTEKVTWPEQCTQISQGDKTWTGEISLVHSSPQQLYNLNQRQAVGRELKINAKLSTSD